MKKLSKEEVDKVWSHKNWIRDKYAQDYRVFAYTMYYFGITDLEVCSSDYCGGKRRHPLELLFHPSITSLTAYSKNMPYVDETPLPWYLLKKLEIRYNGSASTESTPNFCQFSQHPKNLPKSIEPEKFFANLYMYFQLIKRKYPEGIKK